MSVNTTVAHAMHAVESVLPNHIVAPTWMGNFEAISRDGDETVYLFNVRDEEVFGLNDQSKTFLASLNAKH